MDEVLALMGWGEAKQPSSAAAAVPIETRALAQATALAAAVRVYVGHPSMRNRERMIVALRQFNDAVASSYTSS